jgi:uncharacterized protein (DUF488 family)
LTTVYTLGHSRHPAEHFSELLRSHEVERLADVRSHPSSKWSPQFTKAELSAQLRARGIDYVFLGGSLGGRPEGAQYYTADGHVDAARRSQAADFLAGIARLLELASERRTVILCAEEDPSHCHRRVLVTPALQRAGVRVVHIRGDGRLEPDAGAASPAQLGLFAPPLR